MLLTMVSGSSLSSVRGLASIVTDFTGIDKSSAAMFFQMLETVADGAFA